MANKPPRGIVLLFLLHLVLGTGGTVGLIVKFLVSGQWRAGIPLIWLVSVALWAVLGIGLGVALYQGKAWGWYVGSTLYFAFAAVTAILSFRLRSTLGASWVEDLTGRASAAPYASYALVAAVLVALGIAVYFYKRTVRTHFDLLVQAWWPPAVGHLLVVGLLVAVGLAVSLPIPEELSASRADALHAIGARQGNGADEIEILLDALDSGTVEERATAAWALGQSGRTDVLPVLLEAAADDSETDVRINAIAAAAGIGDDTVLAAIVGFLEDREAAVRAAALRGLADRVTPEHLEAVAGRLEDEDDEIRSNAVDVIARIPGPESLDALAGVIDDPSSDVRTHAAFALGKRSGPPAVGALTELLGDAEWEVRANAVQALGMIGDPSARPALSALRNDPSGPVRDAVERALERLPRAR